MTPAPHHLSQAKKTTIVVAAGEGKPKRPLSAYNFFFQEKRQELLKNRPVRPEGKPSRRGHGKMGFALMAKTIAAEWNTIDAHSKQKYDLLAKKESIRYKREIAEWKKQTKARKKQEKQAKKLHVAPAAASPATGVNNTNTENNNMNASRSLQMTVPTSVYVPMMPSSVDMRMMPSQVSLGASSLQEQEDPFINDSLFDDEEEQPLNEGAAALAAAPVLSSPFAFPPNAAPVVNGNCMVGCQQQPQQSQGAPFQGGQGDSLGHLLLQGARMQTMVPPMSLHQLQQPQPLPPAMLQLQNSSDLQNLAQKLEDDCVDLFLNIFH